jgi:hypothetical protein
MQKRLLLFVVVFMLFALFGSTPNLHAQAGSVVGAWEITVNVNVPPGAPPFIFTEVGTFSLGGTFTDTISIAHSSENPYLPPPLAVDFSDGYGTWRQTPGTNQFAGTFKRLLYAGPYTPVEIYGPGPLLPGQQVGEAIIELAGTLQSDGTVAGRFTFQLTNLASAEVFADGGTFTATRINIRPLETN